VDTGCHIQVVAAELEAPRAPESASRIAEHLVAVGDAVGSAAQTVAEVHILVLKAALGVDSLALLQMEDRHRLAAVPEVDTSDVTVVGAE
jgi:hypothetical protein